MEPATKPVGSMRFYVCVCYIKESTTSLYPLTLHQAYQAKYQTQQTDLCKEEIDSRVGDNG